MLLLASFLLFSACSGTQSVALAQNQVAVKGDIVYTMAGEPITNGIVLVRDGRIERVGSQSSISVPDGYDVFEAPVVTPGIIDTRSVVGLAGIYNVPHDQDQLETSSPFQPELRAFDAYNAREDLVVWLRNLGITTVHTGHGPGALASGQTMIVKTFGNTVEEALVDSTTMVSFTLGPSVGSNFGGNPGTRSRSVALIRSEFLKAVDYMNRDNPPRDLRMEILVSILKGGVRAMVSAHRVSEIMAALRLQREFGFDLVIEGASEAYLVADELKEAGVHIILHPTMTRTRGETTNAAFTTAAVLAKHGIPFTFQSGFESYVPKTRVVHYEAAIAVANGLSFDHAMRALTIDAARFLGIDSRVGSLERGKDADIVLWEGDPFEYLSRVCTVFIHGEVASDQCR
ncbi:MAG: amidohydrolase family protein [Balneolales bacterium]|nr:amidohydrolase family protein [Balneolales bacterium]